MSSSPCVTYTTNLKVFCIFVCHAPQNAEGKAEGLRKIELNLTATPEAQALEHTSIGRWCGRLPPPLVWRENAGLCCCMLHP